MGQKVEVRLTDDKCRVVGMDSPKGPYDASAGKPVKLTVNMTPVLLDGTVPEIVPVMVDPVKGSKLTVGRTASNDTPGVFVWTLALPYTPIYRARGRSTVRSSQKALSSNLEQ